MDRSTVGAQRTARLSDGELATLRAMLDEQLSFRVDQLAQLRHPDAPGPLSSADREVFASLTTGAHTALRDVRNALRRMDEGRYGRCTSCGDPVGRERLEVLPQVALCMSCQRATAG